MTAWNALCIVVKVERNLTLRCSLLVHEPMTLYSGEDLLDIWYWKMSYLPGASPFSLKDTGVPALPAAETGHVRKLTYINFAPHWMSSSGSVSRSAEEGSHLLKQIHLPTAVFHWDVIMPSCLFAIFQIERYTFYELNEFLYLRLKCLNKQHILQMHYCSRNIFSGSGFRYFWYWIYVQWDLMCTCR